MILCLKFCFEYFAIRVKWLLYWFLALCYFIIKIFWGDKTLRYRNTNILMLFNPISVRVLSMPSILSEFLSHFKKIDFVWHSWLTTCLYWLASIIPSPLILFIKLHSISSIILFIVKIRLIGLQQFIFILFICFGDWPCVSQFLLFWRLLRVLKVLVTISIAVPEKSLVSSLKKSL